jgi:hypothetical protein
MRSIALFTLLAVALPLVVAKPHKHNARHNEVAKRGEDDVGLRKRFSNAQFTFYEAGMSVVFRGNWCHFLADYACCAGVPAGNRIVEAIIL